MNNLANNIAQNYLNNNNGNNNGKQGSFLGSGPGDWLTNAAVFAGSDALLNHLSSDDEEKNNHNIRNIGIAGALALAYQYYKNHHGQNNTQQFIPAVIPQQQYSQPLYSQPQYSQQAPMQSASYYYPQMQQQPSYGPMLPNNYMQPSLIPQQQPMFMPPSPMDFGGMMNPTTAMQFQQLMMNQQQQQNSFWNNGANPYMMNNNNIFMQQPYGNHMMGLQQFPQAMVPPYQQQMMNPYFTPPGPYF